MFFVINLENVLQRDLSLQIPSNQIHKASNFIVGMKKIKQRQ